MDTWSGQLLGPGFLEIILPLLPSPWPRKTENPQGDFLRGPAGVRMNAVLRVSASAGGWRGGACVSGLVLLLGWGAILPHYVCSLLQMLTLSGNSYLRALPGQGT